MQNILQTRYYNINKKEQGKYLVQTRSQAKTSGIILLEEHGIEKEIKTVTQPQKCILPETEIYLILNQE